MRLAAPVALLGAASCVTPAPEAGSHLRFELRAAQLGGMRNGAVAEGVWTGGEPELADLDLAERRGVRLVIDLRACSPRRPSLAACEELGMQCVALPLPHELEHAATDEQVDAVLELLDRRVPTLVVCEDGSRSATMLALHRLVLGQTSLELALQELRGVGSLSEEDEDFLCSQALVRTVIRAE